MTYKKIYMTFNIKRHMHARVIFRRQCVARLEITMTLTNFLAIPDAFLELVSVRVNFHIITRSCTLTSQLSWKLSKISGRQLVAQTTTRKIQRRKVNLAMVATTLLYAFKGCCKLLKLETPQTFATGPRHDRRTACILLRLLTAHYQNCIGWQARADSICMH